MKRLYLMMTITNRVVGSGRFVDFYRAFGAPVVFTALGRGTASDDMLSYLGLEATEKAVLFSVVTPQCKEVLVKELLSTMHLNTPGSGIAKKIDMMAFAIAQGMTQGTLPLIGYNYSSGDHRRMLSALRVLLLDCLLVAAAGMALMLLAAAPITRCFIDDAATVSFGCDFLRIVALACPSTALNFLAITIFQATGKKFQPLLLSLLRKGGLDIPLMLLFDHLAGISGIAWATPLADLLALAVSAGLTIPCLRQWRRGS